MSIFKKIFFALLLIVGLYISFFPNTWTQASMFDFFKNQENFSDSNSSFDLDTFSKIPVLRGGRVKPLDSVARNILLVLRNKRTALKVVENDELKIINDIKNKKVLKKTLTEDEIGKLAVFSKSKTHLIPQNGVETIAVEVPAIDWLAQVLFAPEKADNLKTFLIDHDQVLGLISQKLSTNGKFYSYNELKPFLSNIDSAARKAGEIESEKRNSFEQNIIELYRSLLTYKKLKHSLSPPITPERPEVLEQMDVADLVYDSEQDTAISDEYIRFRKLTAKLAKDPTIVKLGSKEFAKVVYFVDKYNQANLWTEFLPIPPTPSAGDGIWKKVTESLVGQEPLESKEKQKMDPAQFAANLRELLSMDEEPLKERIRFIRDNQKMNPSAVFATQYAEVIKLLKGIDPIIFEYENLASAYLENKYAEFNTLAKSLYQSASERSAPKSSTLLFEKTFNGYEPFYRSSIAYIFIFIIASTSWLLTPFSNATSNNTSLVKVLRNSAYYLTIIVFLCHTFGLAARMYIEGRPPVTNLYSSALFIGWGAVLLCLGTEKYIRLGIASAMGSLIGFGSLIIAQSLSMDSSLNPTGDTMEMMRAVLDSNFWLATHVVIITIGYSTTFLGGFLGIAFVIYRFGSFILPQNSWLGKKLISVDKDANRILGSMIFGITCFSLFFSLVGTILGGIWADQSWGRFWGWDAKENGALLIVIWNAIILHARLSGMAKTCGLATLSIFGNIVTAWSWFGTNMLGVGLHSYGFMDKAFIPLMYFFGSQILFILIAYCPSAWNWGIKLLKVNQQSKSVG
jgi:ABC-type transport system involved in cytochrome c biogenesis permease subunit